VFFSRFVSFLPEGLKNFQYERSLVFISMIALAATVKNQCGILYDSTASFNDK